MATITPLRPKGVSQSPKLLVLEQKPQLNYKVLKAENLQH